jgi:hypothetical protein
MAHTYNPNTQEAEVGGSFQANLGYIVVTLSLTPSPQNKKAKTLTKKKKKPMETMRTWRL